MDRLRQYRRQQNLSQAQLGAMVGVHYTQIWRWETGRRVPDAVQIVALCRALGITPNDLLAN